MQTKVEIITKRLLLDLDHKEGWVPKNWCFWTVVLEKTLVSPLDSKIKPVYLMEINPEYSLEGLMLKLKLQFWSSDGKSWLIGKDPDARKDWRQKKRAAEDEMVGWHHRLSGHEFKSKLQKIVEDRGTWHTAIHGVTKSQTSLSDWTNDDSNYDICQLHIRVCVCVMHNYCAFGIQGKLRKKQTWSENHFMQPLLTRILNVHVTWVY